MAETDTNWSPVWRVYPIHATAEYEPAYTDTPSMPSAKIDPYFAYQYIAENSPHVGGDPEANKEWEKYMEQVKQKQTGPYVDPYYLYRHRAYYKPLMSKVVYKDVPNDNTIQPQDNQPRKLFMVPRVRRKQILYHPVVTATPLSPTNYPDYILPTDYPDY